MSIPDGNSTTRPLRRRQSKRFDRSAGSPTAAAGSTIVDTGDDRDIGEDIDTDGEVEVDVPEPGNDLSDRETSAVEAGPVHDPEPATESTTGEEASDGGEPAEATVVPSPSTLSAPTDGVQSRRTEPPVRNRTLDQMAPCGRCGHDVSIVHIEVDGNVLMMESCDNCDTRRWQLAGEPIELQQALDHVEEHTGRRR